MPLDPDDIGELDNAILDYFLDGQGDSPWGKATPLNYTEESKSEAF